LLDVSEGRKDCGSNLMNNLERRVKEVVDLIFYKQKHLPT